VRTGFGPGCRSEEVGVGEKVEENEEDDREVGGERQGGASAKRDVGIPAAPAKETEVENEDETKDEEEEEVVLDKVFWGGLSSVSVSLSLEDPLEGAERGGRSF